MRHLPSSGPLPRWPYRPGTTSHPSASPTRRQSFSSLTRAFHKASSLKNESQPWRVLSSFSALIQMYSSSVLVPLQSLAVPGCPWRRARRRCFLLLSSGQLTGQRAELWPSYSFPSLPGREQPRGTKGSHRPLDGAVSLLSTLRMA